MDVKIKSFGSFDKIEYDEINIENDEFLVTFSNLGARINRWILKESNLNIILGFEDANQAHLGEGYYYGATIGPIAGRIKNGEFVFNNHQYQLDQNSIGNHLHGGQSGYDLRLWDYEIIERTDSVSVVFKLDDTNFNTQYPANVKMKVTHTISSNMEWTIEYDAESDSDTIFNPTNHVYFNLNGNESNVLNHQLQVNADYYLPIDDTNAPLGNYESVINTGFDLREGAQLKDVVNQTDAQMRLHRGLDHAFIMNKENGEHDVYVSNGELSVKMKTCAPAVVIYTHNYSEPKLTIFEKPIENYAGIAIEAQIEPDAINNPNFNNIKLEKGQNFYSKTCYWIERLKN